MLKSLLSIIHGSHVRRSCGASMRVLGIPTEAEYEIMLGIQVK